MRQNAFPKSRETEQTICVSVKRKRLSLDSQIVVACPDNTNAAVCKKTKETCPYTDPTAAGILSRAVDTPRYFLRIRSR